MVCFVKCQIKEIRAPRSCLSLDFVISVRLHADISIIFRFNSFCCRFKGCYSTFWNIICWNGISCFILKLNDINRSENDSNKFKCCLETAVILVEALGTRTNILFSLSESAKYVISDNLVNCKILNCWWVPYLCRIFESKIYKICYEKKLKYCTTFDKICTEKKL